MAGIVWEMEQVRAWVERAVSGLSLKAPGTADNAQYTYTLTAPRCFFDKYPDIIHAERNLPSVLLRLDGVDYTADATTYSVRMVLGVWDSGVHHDDNFKKASDGVTIEHPADAPDYVKGQTAVTDLLNLADVLVRAMRHAQAIGGLQLSGGGIHVELADDDDIALAGFRFASVTAELFEVHPITTPAKCLSSADIDGDDEAEDFTTLL